jgi:hypothetical protein
VEAAAGQNLNSAATDPWCDGGGYHGGLGDRGGAGCDGGGDDGGLGDRRADDADPADA